MRVNIIAPDYRSDWIIARLARHLIERNGWTANLTPDKRAAVNVFIPYWWWGKTNWDRTLTAAWFTHKEEASVERGAKLRRWKSIAPAVDLRVTPAALYVLELSAHGIAVQIPHPVELKKFKLKGRPRNPKPTIGVSGRVYDGGRKGEKLVGRLYGEHTPKWRIRAAGRGWPIPSRWYQWKRLQEFYHGLDVFLCTSMVEGGPVTVLEALSCGRPVVIPRGVGQMDELREGPGVRHYKRGEYQDMVRAIIAVLRDRAEPAQLRTLVAAYTPKRYAQQWKDAIRTLVEASA